ncbi:hypothetical protein GF326_03785 [Candidatus Bathyarchaeota archaeon]|nr:hypothetical protein [Candidatus Bathyarchaeota archaeon]
MNSKKAITLLILATMLLAMVPFVPVSAALNPALEETDGTPLGLNPDVKYDDTIAVVEAAGDVPSGDEIEIYWDISNQPWDGEAGLLNVSTAEADGGYEIWFDVPEATIGTHWIWIKTDSQSPEKLQVTIVPAVDLSSSSGLEGEKIDVEGYGFSGENDLAVFLVDDADFTAGVNNWDWDYDAGGADPADTIGDGATDQEFDGNLVESPILPGTLVITDAGAAHDILDDAEGALWSDEDDSGTINAGDLEVGSINYVSGAYEIDYNDAGVAATAAITAAYTGYQNGNDPVGYAQGYVQLMTTSGDTDALGSYTKSASLPDAADDGAYDVALMDGEGNIEGSAFAVGAVIELSASEGPTGMILTIDGRGFTNGANIPEQLAVDGGQAGIDMTDTVGGGGTEMVCTIYEYDPADQPQVDGDGEFTIDVFVPDMGDEDDYYVAVSDGAKYAEADFELTALPEVTATPDYGPQGSTVTVTGTNFPNDNDVEVDIELWQGGAKQADVETDVELDSDGEFSVDVRTPTQPDGTYDLTVIYSDNAGAANIDADTTFRIGSVLVLLSDDVGEVGKEVVLTGNGFTDNEQWNATFGDVAIFEDAPVTGDGLLDDGGTPTFFVPQVEPGTYDITVLDIDTGIEVVVEFEVTATTTVVVEPVEAPTQFNISLTGYNWMEDTGNWEFTLYNDTDEWDMSADVFQGDPPAHVPLGAADGTEWEAWFWLADDAQDDLDKGTYTMNITQDDDFFYQFEIVVGNEHEYIAPRKSTFRIDDTVSFRIEHSFGNVAPVTNGDIRVFDPAGDLYWDGDPLATWEEVNMFYIAPISEQTAGGNPMVLLDDAPLGTWTYEWREQAPGRDEIANGTFTVEVAAEDVLSNQITDLNNQVTDLQDSIADVSAEFDDVKSDIADVSAVAQQAVDAANQASEAVQTVAETANQASTAAENAADAANAAKDAANSLTTLVYGAIGAALVAALAAIVSLMQISRRIAG